MRATGVDTLIAATTRFDAWLGRLVEAHTQPFFFKRNHFDGLPPVGKRHINFAVNALHHAGVGVFLASGNFGLLLLAAEARAPGLDIPHPRPSLAVVFRECN